MGTYYDYSDFSGWIGKTGVDILDITFFLFLPWAVLFLFLMESVFFVFDAIRASFFHYNTTEYCLYSTETRSSGDKEKD
jgi:hypothetical protein